MSRRFATLLALATVLLCATGSSLLLHLPAGMDHATATQLRRLAELLAISVVVYFVAVRLILRHDWPRATVWMVLAVAVVLRGLLLVQPPLLSSDIYRYVWDGRVQKAGINPYRYVPADPALASLRDTAIYPSINRADYAHTIYPPVAQLVFVATVRVWDSLTSMRLAMLGFEALGVGCVLVLLRFAGLPPERILIYAWNPLVLWSFASDGHADAILIGLLGLALVLRARHRDGWAGAVLASAVLVKFVPLVVAPALLRGGRFWRPVLAGTAVIVVSYGLYISAGVHVLGFLPSYGGEEGMMAGDGFWLLAALNELTPLPAGAMALYALGAATVLLALAVRILRQPTPASDVRALCRDSAVLAAATMVAASPHYHWYFAWIALPAVLVPSRALLWLTTAPLLYLINPLPDDRFLWPSLIYLPVVPLSLVDFYQRRSTRRRKPTETGGIAWPLQSP